MWAAALYVANWVTIVDQGSYFARFAPPLPLDHLWSLAIEEQFYLLWPFLLLAMIWLLRSRPRMALVTLVLAGCRCGRWPTSTTRSTPPACTRERTRVPGS